MGQESKLHHKCRIKIKLNGYAALIMVLSVSVMILVIGVSVAIVSINQGQMSTIEQKKEAALSFVESCTAETLMKLDKYRVVPTTVTLPLGTCTISNSRSGFDWTITVTGAQENYTKTIRVVVKRTTSVDVNSWMEI